ncbi:MAG: elongation factor G, partial [Syntrophales bacterium]
MSKYEPNSLRNIAIVGHGSTGKTSLCESLLFITGKTDRQGRVDDGTSSMDFEPEEQKRRISISAAANFVEWEKHRITILDTPGDSNFSYDTRNCLRVADGAVVVIDAVGGVEFQTEKVWEYADEYKLPRIVFISRMDRERADFFTSVETIKSRLGKKATPVFLPIGKEDTFKGVIDLISKKALIFDGTSGKYKSADIPADMKDIVEKYRENMVEDIAESDEKLMDKYLDAGELSDDELKAGLKKGVMSLSLLPVACGSAVKNIGIAPLIDLVINALPSPVERGPVTGKKPGKDEIETRTPEESAPFSALVFKTIADPYAGRLTLFRVFSGTVTSDSTFYNSSRKITERFGNIFFLEGKSQKPVESLVPGDIAAVAKLKETTTGDTVCNEKAAIIFEKVVPPPPIMSFAVAPKSRGDEDKIVSSINRIIEED